MRIIFKLSQAKSQDLEQLKQFDICLLGTRLMQPNVPMAVQIPEQFYYPSTWIGLKRLGVKITRAEVTPLPEDIVSLGTHVPISRLTLKPLPCVPQHQLQIPEVETDFETAIQWLEANRTGDRIWLAIPANNPLYWNSPPLKSELPMQQWLEWAYWRKAQPTINPATRTFSGFIRQLRVQPPSQTM